MNLLVRFSKAFQPTLKEVPKDAEVASHVLMLRAGMMRMLSAGLYTYLPLGLRVIQKVAEIVREEMNRAGAQEVQMPTLQPDTLWKQSGRWEDMGPELMRLVDRNERHFVLGPTHEEVITALVSGAVASYRDLPKNLYQIQTKFRDEVRPRFGVMRAREFLMKDAYSFDRDEQGCEHSYWEMYRAYDRIFRRCGLETRAVAADTGAIGGKFSHEFMALAEAGEAEIAVCDGTDFAANLEVCPTLPPPPFAQRSSLPPAELIDTPGRATIEEVTALLGKKANELVKTLLFTAKDRHVAVLVRGDREANGVKVSREIGALAQMSDPETVRRLTRAEVGYAGPIGLDPSVEIWADPEVMAMPEAVTGANQTGKHYLHVVPGRDFKPSGVLDLRWAVAGDLCADHPDRPIRIVRGIEVGQVFKLGLKYSTALEANFQDEDGSQKPMVMGCYGIGVTRTVAAVIEQHHDEKGIIWPVSVAPCDVHVLSLGAHLPEVAEASDRLAREIHAAGLDVFYDDREERPGVKFKDADLIGVPFQVAVGQKSLAKGVCEVTRRADGTREEVPLEKAVSVLQSLRESELRRLALAEEDALAAVL
ncbi:MAG: Proline--tRNA ligase [bacterium]|nr:Proline--tRNA ligase [bacterium]